MNIFASKRHVDGFTLIEILVVIAIIGLLTAIIVANLNQAKSKARDAKRKSDTKEVLFGLQVYHETHDTFAVSGTGANGNGSGWYPYAGNTTYTKSIAQGLIDDGELSTIAHDPLVPVTKTSSNGQHTYMVYPPTGGLTAGVCVYAQLENPTADDTSAFDIAHTAAPTWVQSAIDNNGMNFATCS